jgi:hypothetical protein
VKWNPVLAQVCLSLRGIPLEFQVQYHSTLK